jgi:hypothetical protein
MGVVSCQRDVYTHMYGQSSLSYAFTACIWRIKGVMRLEPVGLTSGFGIE